MYFFHIRTFIFYACKARTNCTNNIINPATSGAIAIREQIFVTLDVKLFLFSQRKIQIKQVEIGIPNKSHHAIMNTGMSRYPLAGIFNSIKTTKNITDKQFSPMVE